MVSDEKRVKVRLSVMTGIAAVLIIMTFCFDAWYDLNDDYAIRDILSGAYTGVPEGRCIQLLYPLGAFISLLYGSFPGVSWFGLILMIFQYVSLWIMADTIAGSTSDDNTPEAVSGRSLKVKLPWIPIAAGGVLPILIVLVFSREFVFIQYTFTAGMMCAAAALRFCFRGPDTTAIIMALLAFNLRSEMMLLLCPLLVLGLLYGTKRSQRQKSIRYMVLGAALMVLCAAADNRAYSSEDWREFRDLFDYRTEVYDFYGVPDHDDNEQFYDSIGLSRQQVTLLTNYDYDLDEAIDARVMGRIADYAAAHQGMSPGRRAWEAVYAYVYRFLHGQELILDLLLLAAYYFILTVAFKAGDKDTAARTALLFFIKTGLWLFLLYRGRVPERITHPLYMTEMSVLAFLLYRSFGKSEEKRGPRSYQPIILFSVIALCAGMINMTSVSQESQKREEKNQEWIDLRGYMGQHPEMFYYIDVYSSVAYSEKIFTDPLNSAAGGEGAYRNHDLAGGWCVKSPLALSKRAGRSLTSEDALFVYRENGAVQDVDFIKELYRSKGIETDISQTDTVSGFKILQIRQQ